MDPRIFPNARYKSVFDIFALFCDDRVILFAILLNFYGIFFFEEFHTYENLAPTLQNRYSSDVGYIFLIFLCLDIV